MSEWISVEDRLPEKTGPVIVYNPEAEFDYRIFSCWFEEWFYDESEGWQYDFVTHWQPLPPPPQK